MKIQDKDGNEIRTFDDWAKLYDTPQQSHQWKEHRSAWSMAEFTMHQGVSFERAIPEFEQRFDSYGRGRVHDYYLEWKAKQLLCVHEYFDLR